MPMDERLKRVAEPPLPTLVIGESLVDILTDDQGVRHAHPGGSPANVALGLARLGLPVHFATRTGRDRHGEAVRDHLVRNGVRLTEGSVAAGPTSTASVALDVHGRADYAFHITWELPASTLGLIGRRPAPYAHLHTGSIAGTLAPGAAQVLAAVRAARSSATVSYDPNLRPALLGEPNAERPKIEALVTAADLVKASDEDLAWLYPGTDPARAAAAWVGLGPALVVLTCGANGAKAFWRHGSSEVAAVHAEVVDTVGAGDAFMAGLIGGLRRAGLLGNSRARSALSHATGTAQLPPPIDAALVLAAQAAAVTCGRPGADPPTPDELPAAAAPAAPAAGP